MAAVFFLIVDIFCLPFIFLSHFSPWSAAPRVWPRVKSPPLDVRIFGTLSPRRLTWEEENYSLIEGFWTFYRVAVEGVTWEGRASLYHSLLPEVHPRYTPLHPFIPFYTSRFTGHIWKESRVRVANLFNIRIAWMSQPYTPYTLLYPRYILDTSLHQT